MSVNLQIKEIIRFQKIGSSKNLQKVHKYHEILDLLEVRDRIRGLWVRVRI
jgi:hypothetical protein